MNNLLFNMPLFGQFFRFLKTKAGLIFVDNLKVEKWHAIQLLVTSNSSAFLASIRVLFVISFLQVFSGEGKSTISVKNWYFPEFLNQEYKEIIILGSVMVTITIISFFIDYWQRVSSIKLNTKFVRSLRRLMINHAFKLDAKFFGEGKMGEISYNLSTPISATSNTLYNFQQGISYLLRVIMVFAVVVYLQPLLTISIVMASSFLVFFISHSQRKLKKIAELRRGCDLKSNGIFVDMLFGMRLIKQATKEVKFKTKFIEASENRDSQHINYTKESAFSHLITQIIGFVTVLSVAGFVMVLSKFNIMENLGFVIGYMMAVMRLFNEVTVSVNFFTSAIQEIPHLKEMNKFMGDTKYLESTYFKGKIKNFDAPETITIKNSTFSYEENKQVLQNVNLEFKSGKMVALIGLSGSGKTTLLEIASGYRANQSGSIKIDNKDLSDLDIKEYRKKVGYLNQDTILFNDSLKENIGFIKEGCGEEEIIKAAKKACAHDFIMEGKNGYDTNIGDRGQKISGGQRQRIALARMFLQNPPIILLDEATSALDYQTEREIMDNIFSEKEKRIIVVATHRLTTITKADQIYFIHKGKILEEGSHHKLMRQKGMYYDLYDFQMKAEDTFEKNELEKK